MLVAIRAEMVSAPLLDAPATYAWMKPPDSVAGSLFWMSCVSASMSAALVADA